MRRTAHPLLTVTLLLVCCFPGRVVSQCPGKSSSRLEYLTQSAYLGDDVLQDASAAATIGSLGYSWRAACHWGRVARGYFSPRSRYCLLLWGCSSPDVFGEAFSACLVDSCGIPLWVLDVDSDAPPTVSGTGTVAFISRASGADSVQITFVDPSGHRLGTWTTTPDSLGIPSRWSWCVREFLPQSQNLVVLGVRAPRNLTGLESRPPSLRLIASSGEQRWSRQLHSPNCNRLYLSASGSLIVAYGPIAYVNSGEQALREYEIQVFTALGERIAHIQGHGDWELNRLVIDSSDKFLYYDFGTVTAFDLAAGRALSSAPEEPLIVTTHSDDPASARMADALLARITGRSAGVPRK